MNQCIINVVDKMVFLAFNEIVEEGKIEVLSMDGDTKSLFKLEIKKTNFTNLRLPSKKGRYKLEIEIDGQHITKSININ
ncbi:MAG: hypothetical protein HQ521_09190 [Bacteroidetes bacterium]|nr:hypothetical protein [Bacteroidota bacterium]